MHACACPNKKDIHSNVRIHTLGLHVIHTKTFEYLTAISKAQMTRIFEKG